VSVEPFLKYQALGPKTLNKLGTAYDSMVEFLEIYEDLPKARRELLALQMVILAQHGERDIDLICQKAVAYLKSVDAATASLQPL
jgi:hypothetical protein